jgi:hypothetical protein
VPDSEAIDDKPNISKERDVSITNGSVVVILSIRATSKISISLNFAYEFLLAWILS